MTVTSVSDGYISPMPSHYGKKHTTKKATAPKKMRCWKGYKPVQGKKAYSKGSCKKR